MNVNEVRTLFDEEQHRHGNPLEARQGARRRIIDMLERQDGTVTKDTRKAREAEADRLLAELERHQVPGSYVTPMSPNGVPTGPTHGEPGQVRGEAPRAVNVMTAPGQVVVEPPGAGAVHTNPAPNAPNLTPETHSLAAQSKTAELPLDQLPIEDRPVVLEGSAKQADTTTASEMNAERAMPHGPPTATAVVPGQTVVVEKDTADRADRARGAQRSDRAAQPEKAPKSFDPEDAKLANKGANHK